MTSDPTPTPIPFPLAMAQMWVTAGDLPGNLDRARQRIAEAAARGARIVLLPEAMDLGWTDPSAADHASPIPDGAACQALRRAAQAHRIWVCAGITERDGTRVFNAAVLIADTGAVVLHHRKINELEFAHALYARGDRVAVADTPFGRIGILICADAFVPGHPISRTLGLLGAQIILSPCAWAVPAGYDPAREPYGRLWRDCYGPVAREFGLWFAGVSSVGVLTGGPWAGRHCIGCSLLMDPSGNPVAEGPYGVAADTLLLAEIRPGSVSRRCLGP